MSTINDCCKFAVQPARGTRDIEDVRRLFKAYASWLNVDLQFQNFADELDSLPGRYEPPKGEILLVRDSGDIAVGCVAFRPLQSETICEMKRLYIVPDARRYGLGRMLVDEIIRIATQSGYKEMRLDTLQYMDRAIDLYKQSGFQVIQPYYANPLSNVVYLAKALI